jgi:hypothetical protein
VETGSTQSGPTATTTTLTSSANPSRAGNSVTFTASVTPPPSGGTFNFTDGGTTIPGCGAVPLAPDAQATCTTSFGFHSTHSIVVHYTGNSLFAGSSSATLTQTVQPATAPPNNTTSTSGNGSGNAAGGGGGGGGGVVNPIGGGSGAGGTSSSSRATAAFGQVKVSRTTAVIPVTCNGPSGAQCAFTVTLAAREVRRGNRLIAVGAAKAKTRRVKVTIGAASVAVPAGTTRTVPVSLNARGKRLLKRFKRLKVSLAVTERGRRAAVLQRSVRFKR